MNSIVTLIKKRGTTIALPLLLLTTACGPDGGIPDSFSGSDALDDLSKYKLTVDDGSYTATKVVAANKAVTAASVPEPFTIAGLAVTALGLGALKRRA